MPTRSPTGERRLVFSDGQSLALGAGSVVPMNGAFRRVYFGVRGGHQGDPRILQPYSDEVAPDLETAEGNVFSQGSGYEMEFSGDATVGNWELSPTVAAALKTIEYEAGGSQRKYVALGAGLGGTVYANLGPGSASWDEMITETTAAYGALSASAKRQVSAYSMHVTHGETDSSVGTTQATYLANLIQWRERWRDAMNLITGRSDEPPMFIDMMNYTASSGGSAEDDKRRAILRAQRSFGSQTNGYVVGPKPSIFIRTTDLIHYADVAAYYYIGEQHAKVAYRVIEEDESWVPMRWTSITAQPGNVVRVALNVPRGRAVLDPRPQRQAGCFDGQFKGFTYTDDGAAQIIGIDVQSNYIDLQLDAAPSTTPRLTHGYVSQELNGQVGFCRDYIHDQDTEYKSAFGEPLYNWLCPFVKETVS